MRPDRMSRPAQPLPGAGRFPRPGGWGFTLVELLVVVAILALLLTLLIPSLRLALEASRRATCASNLRTLAMGALVYSGDADGQLPFAVGYSSHFVCISARGWSGRFQGWGSNEANGGRWTTSTEALVERYLGGRAGSDACVPHATRCPSNRARMSDSAALGGTGFYPDNVSDLTSYQFMGYTGWYRSVASADGFDKAAALFPFTTANASRLAVKYGQSYLLFQDWLNVKELNQARYFSNHGVAPYDGTGANSAFHDGHVRWTRWDWGGEAFPPSSVPPPGDPRWMQVMGDGYNFIAPRECVVLHGHTYKRLWANGVRHWLYSELSSTPPTSPF